LDLDADPADPARPVGCRDECPVPLLDDGRVPLPAAAKRPRHRDDEYRRCGPVCLAVVFDPHRGWRHVTASERRTKLAVAGWLKELGDVHYPQAETVRLVVDNLTTHSPAALDEAFAPAQAHRIARKLEWPHTPKHGSGLNLVEIELSVLASQCLDRRLPDLTTLARATTASAAHRNAARATLHWRFTTADARTKLDHLYPIPQPA
jgi:DDE superfamily endonuclease